MKNNLFTILYVITIALIIGIVVANEFVFQRDVLEAKNVNNKLINLAGEQSIMIQKIAKSAAAMVYASDRSEKNYVRAQAEVESSLERLQLIYKGIRDGSDDLGIESQLDDNEIASLYQETKGYNTLLENSSNSLILVKFKDGDRKLKLQRFTNDIFQLERNFTERTQEMANRFLATSEVNIGRYSLLEWVLLGSLGAILLIQSLFIFRPTVNLAGKNFLSANKAYQKVKKSEEDLRKSYDSQIAVNKELKRSKKQMEIKNAQLEESEKKLLRSTKEQISINEKLLKTQKDLEGAYQKLQNSEVEIRELADKQLEDNEKLFLAEKKMKDLLSKEQSATKNLNDAMNRLKGTQSQLVHSEKMASLGQLTAGIAHEINNPINFIYNGISSIKMSLESVKEVLEKYSELEEEGTDPAELKEEILELKEDVEYEELLEDLDEILNDVNYGAVRTIEIVKGLRVFSRLDEEESKPALINENIDATLTLLKNKTKNKITVSKFYDDTIGEIECYPGQLNQVYMNILNNAIQAMPEDRKNPEIQIYTENIDDNAVVIRIKDNGCGIPDEVRQRIFEPFFTTKPVGVGTGLGMSISFGIIEKHGGKIELNSEVGVGTEFVITLPKKIDKTKNKEDVYSLNK